MIVLLDSGPLGMITNPCATSENQQCRQWLGTLLAAGVRVAVPEIADYEVRRELLRARRFRGIAHLDQAKATLEYIPLTTEAMLLAAQLWAQARQHGQQTAPDLALDGDIILAAQANILAQQVVPVAIATTNVGHLSRFAPAQRWQVIQPPPP